MSAERPGGWVEGIGWVASSFDLRQGDRYLTTFARQEHEADDGTFVVNERMRQRGDLPYPLVITRWADGTEPASPVAAVRADQQGPTDEWNATPPFPTVGDVSCVELYRNHRKVGPAYFQEEADAHAFHAFTNGPSAPKPDALGAAVELLDAIRLVDFASGVGFRLGSGFQSTTQWGTARDALVAQVRAAAPSGADQQEPDGASWYCAMVRDHAAPCSPFAPCTRWCHYLYGAAAPPESVRAATAAPSTQGAPEAPRSEWWCVGGLAEDACRKSHVDALAPCGIRYEPAAPPPEVQGAPGGES